MDADIYSLFLGEDDAKLKAQALAEALRRNQQGAAERRGMATVASLGANPLLAGLQQSMGRSADAMGANASREQQLLAQAGGQHAERALRRALEAERQRFQAAEADKARAFQGRQGALNRAMGRPPPYVIVTGQGGGQFFVDPRNPEKPAMPVMGPEGQLLKPGQESNEGELDAIGYERAPDAPAIKREEAAAFRGATASADNLRQSSSKLRALIQEHGSELWGPTSRKMGAITKDMLLQLKDLAKLGVLSKSDEDIINSIIPNPTGAEGASTSTESMLAQLDQLDELIGQKLGAQAKALGYVPATKPRQGRPTVSDVKDARGELPKAEVGAGGELPEELVPMLSPTGKRVRVPKSRVDAALKAGGRLADG